MAVKTQHREDGLFQRHAEEGCPEQCKGTEIETAFLVHRLILAFLNGLVGRTFADEQALQEALDEWPAFAANGGIGCLIKGFSPMTVDRHMVVCPAGMGGPLVVATIEEATCQCEDPTCEGGNYGDGCPYAAIARGAIIM